jgi:hypothetical protein
MCADQPPRGSHVQALGCERVWPRRKQRGDTSVRALDGVVFVPVQAGRGGQKGIRSVSGVVGLFDYGGTSADSSALRAMTDRLAHRSPDGDSIWAE